MYNISLLSSLSFYQKSPPATQSSVANCGPQCSQVGVKPAAPLTIGQQIADFFVNLFNTKGFPARWHCGQWTDFHGWLYILSDIGIWAAYFSIPFLLLRVLIKRKDVPLNGVIGLFLAFVFLCGLTHLVDALIFWWPIYRLSAVLRLATAIVSIGAAYALKQVFPLLLNLRSVRELKIEIERRKKIEERLSASEFLLSEAGRIAGVGGWEFDFVTKKYSWSKTVYDILEMSYDHDIYQQHPLSYYPEPYRDLISKATEDALSSGTKWDLEVPAVTLKNKTLWVRHIGEPVFNSRGEVVKLRGTLMNIDKYKIHELELSRSLEVTMEQKHQLKNFAYVLSHHIRNHTSNLSGLSAMIEPEFLSEENRNIFLKSNQVTQALTLTLDELAEVIEAQDQIIAHEQVNFETAVTNAIHTQSSQVKQANITYNFEVPSVQFSALYLDNIFKHLLSNAIRYRNPDIHPAIEFRSYTNNEGNIVLECKDNGLGMDLNLYGHKLFGLYATFHNPISSRGVGLYLIKTQIESQGGVIAAKSEPGKGSTFTITFRRQDS